MFGLSTFLQVFFGSFDLNKRTISGDGKLDGVTYGSKCYPVFQYSRHPFSLNPTTSISEPGADLSSFERISTS